MCRDIVDFRKGINGLAIVVEESLQRDPFSEQLFVFCNRRRDKVKILYWGVPRTLGWKLSGAVVKMRVGPSEPLFRKWLQTAHCCCV